MHYYYKHYYAALDYAALDTGNTFGSKNDKLKQKSWKLKAKKLTIKCFSPNILVSDSKLRDISGRSEPRASQSDQTFHHVES